MPRKTIGVVKPHLLSKENDLLNKFYSVIIVKLQVTLGKCWKVHLEFFLKKWLKKDQGR